MKFGRQIGRGKQARKSEAHGACRFEPYLLHMIKNKQPRKGPIEIDLTGPDGNAFALMGYAQVLAKQLDKDPKAIITEMQSSDYEHLVEVFDREFGDFVVLYR